MNISAIEKFLQENNYPKYRFKQIKKAVFVELISNWAEATFLPESLREDLAKSFPISSLGELEILESEKGDAVKAVFKTKDNLKIETVLMKHIATGEKDFGRNTVCVSSQAGCAMGCGFCATGKNGLKRNLTSEEIIDQVLHFARPQYQGLTLILSSENRVNNIVFMGMGEPFLNYENVLEAIRIFNDKDGFNLGIRHISISTCGVVPAIDRFADENLQVNLAISLHSASDNTRTQLMPINKAYPIAKLMTAVEKYVKKTNRKVMFEYLLIDGVNDSQKDADSLAKLMKGPLYHVNLIKYHDTGGKYKPSPKAKRDAFFDALKKRGVSVTQRVSFGEDILAACGQLAGK